MACAPRILLTRMMEIIYRIDKTAGPLSKAPADAREAQTRLERGNQSFSELVASVLVDPPTKHVIPVSASDLGLNIGGTAAPQQAPFAAVLACSDARVPTEMVFDQGFNDLFVVRVAGNVLGGECLGSIRYAVHHFAGSLKLAVVLGHAHCGAVTAAVDAFLEPINYLSTAGNYPLRNIVDQIVAVVRTAATGLDVVCGATVAAKPGYREALIEIAVVLNAAWNAFSLREEIRGEGIGDIKVVFGVYDLITHNLGLLPSPAGAVTRPPSLFVPPANAEEFRGLVQELCDGMFVRNLLSTRRLEKPLSV